VHSIIKKAQLAAAPARKAHAPRDQASESGVRLLSSGGLVHAIEITCSCGEVALVELDYPPAPDPSSPESKG
jgi:hypothetical protein